MSLGDWELKGQLPEHWEEAVRNDFVENQNHVLTIRKLQCKVDSKPSRGKFNIKFFKVDEHGRAVLHKGKPWISFDEVQNIVRKNIDRINNVTELVNVYSGDTLLKITGSAHSKEEDSIFYNPKLFERQRNDHEQSNSGNTGDSGRTQEIGNKGEEAAFKKLAEELSKFYSNSTCDRKIMQATKCELNQEFFSNISGRTIACLTWARDKSYSYDIFINETTDQNPSFVKSLLEKYGDAIIRTEEPLGWLKVFIEVKTSLTDNIGGLTHKEYEKSRQVSYLVLSISNFKEETCKGNFSLQAVDSR